MTDLSMPLLSTIGGADELRGAFNAKQVEQLLRPVHPGRVAKDGKGHPHLSQQDVTAHLIRVFGFGNFDTEVLAAECIFEHNRPKTEGGVSNRWDVGYRALVRLTVRNPDGELVCRYENGSTATAQNQALGDGHDLAYKSAISLAMKRCAINLGDQFGLSLYNKGQLEALVIATMVKPEPEETDEGDEKPDLQEGVPEQQPDEGDAMAGELDEEPKRGLAAVKGGKS